MSKALVVVTSVSKYPDMNRPTRLWLGEVVHFADVLYKNGYDIDYISPEGGYTAIDPASLQEDMMSDLDWKYYQDKDFMTRLGSTLTPDAVRAEDYDIIYYAGGHGTIWDFKDNKDLQPTLFLTLLKMNLKIVVQITKKVTTGVNSLLLTVM